MSPDSPFLFGEAGHAQTRTTYVLKIKISGPGAEVKECNDNLGNIFLESDENTSGDYYDDDDGDGDDDYDEAALTTQEPSVTGSGNEGLSGAVVGGVLGAIVAVALVLVAVIVVVILVVMRKRISWKPEEAAPGHNYNNAVYEAGILLTVVRMPNHVMQHADPHKLATCILIEFFQLSEVKSGCGITNFCALCVRNLFSPNQETLVQEYIIVLLWWTMHTLTQ